MSGGGGGARPLIVGVPVTEEAVARLSYVVVPLAEMYGRVALPLPASLCRRLAEMPGRLVDLVGEYMSGARARIWSQLACRVALLSRLRPELEYTCYLADDALVRADEAVYRLAALVVRERVRPGSVKLRDMIEAYGTSRGFELPEADVVVVEGFYRAVAAAKASGARTVYYVEPLIPTPLDLLALAAEGLLDEGRPAGLPRLVARYVGDYIASSRDLTQAYRRLASDAEYRRFLEEVAGILGGLVELRSVDELLGL